VKKENRECCAEAENTQLQIKSTTTHGGANHESTFFPVLEKRIEQWVGEKCFVEQGITMDTLAYEFCTNRSYLSNYINVSKQKTFREWINYLRIEEAKRLLMEYPGKNINEVASEVGIPDKTYFRKHFVTVTGSSPKVWKTANVG
jgi:YesN/AraC family two-component response regulator